MLTQEDKELEEIEAQIASNNAKIEQIKKFPVVQSEDDELAKIDAQIAANNSKIQEITSNQTSSDLSFTDKALQIGRGAAKTIGGISDTIRQGFPSITPEYNYKKAIELAINSLNGVPGKEEELNKLKEEYSKLDSEMSKSKKDQYLGNLNELAGKDLKPTDTGGIFREKLGEFGVLPTSTTSLKITPAIAAVATGLQKLGIDENYSDLIAAIGVPNFKSILQLPSKVLKRLSDLAATVGSEDFRKAGGVEKAAKFLQEKVGEKNIPQVLENLEGVKTPFKGNISKGEPDYRPLTAEVADNVGLSQYHRAKAGNIPEIGQRRKTNAEVLQREVDKLASKEASPQMSQEFALNERNSVNSILEAENRKATQKVEEAASKFKKTAKVDEAGAKTQEYLDNRVSNIEKEAIEKASPFYKAAEKQTLEGKPDNSFNYIKKQLKEKSKISPVHKDMKNAKIAIENAASSSTKQKEKIINNLKKQYKNDPKMLEIALKEVNNVPHGTYNAAGLERAKQEISIMMQKTKPNERDRRRIFKNLLKMLDKDMESIPDVFKGRETYAEIMKPANLIKENPVLGKIITTNDGYTKPFTVTAAEIPPRVISGSKSIEGAKALMSEFSGAGTKEHKQVIETLKSYINSDILSNFVENNGKVNPDKFKVWSKNNPGAFILYPELKSQLKDLKNAQIHVDKVINENKELLSNYYKKSLSKLLGPKYEGIDSDKIAGKILDSADSVSTMEEAVELLSKDKTGNAIEGLKRGVIDHLKTKFKSDNFTFATLNDYLRKNKKSFEKLFTNDQMEVLEKTKEWLKKDAEITRVGQPGNSDTIPKLMENLAEKTGGKASKALFGVSAPSLIRDTYNYAGNIKEAEKIKYLEKALLNPKMAKYLLKKNIKTNKNFFESLGNKEDFGKWLRESESIMDSILKSAKDIKNNLWITSEHIAKASLANDN